MQTNFGKQYFKQETSKVYPNSAGKLVENRRERKVRGTGVAKTSHLNLVPFRLSFFVLA